MFRRCVFLFSEKYVLERFSFRGIFLGGFSETGAVPKYKKTPVRQQDDCVLSDVLYLCGNGDVCYGAAVSNAL